jgi:mRNA-degrading endonuclease toxin of MazEF toxin-antitoxin module
VRCAVGAAALVEGVEVELAAKSDGFVVRRSAPSYALADQMKNLDWRVRRAEFIGEASEKTMGEVLARIRAILE